MKTACQGLQKGNGGCLHKARCLHKYDGKKDQPLFYTIILASTTLITVPARVANSAPARVKRVLVTFAARKYTLMV